MDTYIPVAFDAGSRSIRFGFCYDRTPSSDIPAVLGDMLDGKESVVHTNRIGENSTYKVDTNTLCVPREGMELINIMDKGLIQDWDAFENLMEYAYSSCLFTDPKLHPIIFTESPMNTDKNRERLMELLFEKFNVPAMMLCKNSAAAAFSCGLQTGIVVDSGATHTTAVPVYEGNVITGAIVSSPMGGDFILNKCEQYLSENNIDVIPHYLIAKKQPVNAKEIPIWSRKNTVPNVTNSWHNYMCKSVVEDFKHTVLEVADRDAILSNLPTCHYEFPNGYNQEFGSERFKIPEFLFNPNESGDLTSLSEIVHLCAEMCSNSIIDELYANIIVTGGNSLIKGFPRRLHLEIAANYKNISRVKLTAPIDSSIRRFGAWIGGALLATTAKLNHLWFSSNDYHENGANEISLYLTH
ncbi:actin-like protein 6B [Acyrthosiphon pisum]|uniref:Actin-like protein 6A n=1 Tax=Acyrthosiphon pisum TaxID=7029 RepID=A0A8R2FD11_ACYPI|nr:actin-like protein 6B [Acyrthosiphon pisum]XP_016659914.1 actin-like protein 6B [Acyrthosiphon pisum]|eukprot:XP_008189579.2 PREDICTED: actin-like protein 6B [Acyrthosiphon pisum]